MKLLKLTLFITILMFTFLSKSNAKYEKIFYDFGGNLIDDRFELSKNVINLIK